MKPPLNWSEEKTFLVYGGKMVLTNCFYAAGVSLVLTMAVTAEAQTFFGTLVQVKGDVKILKKPQSDDTGPLVKYNDVEYVVAIAKVGLRVRPRQIILSGTNGQTKLVYPNGDHFLVGPSTAVVIPDGASAGQGNGKPSLNLYYGKLRALISKGGPRANLELRTRSTVAGVRGTDLFISESPQDGTQITVLRGSVAIETGGGNALDPVFVKSGYSAVVAPVSAGAKSEPPVSPEVKLATKEDLLDVQLISTTTPSPEELMVLEKDLREEVQVLIDTSKEAILKDIKATDPALYTEIQKRPVQSDVDLNTLVVSRLFKLAPSAPVRQKPRLREIDPKSEDVYKKYFDPGN